jgi:signal peptidase I
LRWLAAAGCALLLGALVFRLQYCLVIVSGESMRPTLESGDVLVVNKQAYCGHEPRREDIVVARYKGELVVKRIVGLPGEELEVKDGVLYVNGSQVPEGCTTNAAGFNVEKGRLFDGRFATLGDNRAIAPSSAIHPIVSKDEIVGKVAFLASFWRNRHA